MPVRRVIDLSMPLDERTPFYPGEPELAPRTAIGWDRLAPHADALGPGVIVLLRTGWDAHRETAAYFEHPFLDGDAWARLLDGGVRTIGVDAIDLDEMPAGDLDLERIRCHAQISDAGAVIVENLVGIGAIDVADPFVSVLPRIAGGDGAPARAVAIEGFT